MVNGAKQERAKIFDEKKNEMRVVEEKIEKLEYQRESFYNKLRSEIEAHLKLVDSINPRQSKMKAVEVTPKDVESFDEPEDDDQVEKAELKTEHAPHSAPKPTPAPTPKPSAPPALDMKDDEIDAALDNLSGGSSHKKDDEPEPVGVESNSGNKESEAKKGVQDGQHHESKGFDF